MRGVGVSRSRSRSDSVVPLLLAEDVLALLGVQGADPDAPSCLGDAGWLR